MVRVECASKLYKGVAVLSDIDLQVASGDFVIFTGRSGGGKTTLLSMMGGLTRPDTGKIFIDDKDIWSLSEPALASLRNQKIGFVFQFASLIPTLTVLDNILLSIAFSSRSPKQADLQYAKQLLEKVNMSEWGGHYPSQLSGGQQRRVALARALINRPSIIMTDEPTGDLDEKTEAEIMRFFHSINKEEGTTIIMVTHALAYVHFGKTYTIKEGRLVPYEVTEVAAQHSV